MNDTVKPWFAYVLKSGYRSGHTDLQSALQSMCYEMIVGGEITGVLYRGNSETGEIVASLMIDPRALNTPATLQTMLTADQMFNDGLGKV